MQYATRKCQSYEDSRCSMSTTAYLAISRSLMCSSPHMQADRYVPTAVAEGWLGDVHANVPRVLVRSEGILTSRNGTDLLCGVVVDGDGP